MATKRIGISRELIIHPGETIADILCNRNMTQAELAARTGYSSAYVGAIIAGKKDISTKFAMALEYALGISKSFWLNLQARYDAELLEVEQADSVTEEEKTVRKKLNEVVKHLREQKQLSSKESVIDSIISLRKLLNVSNLCNLAKVHSVSAFRLRQTNDVDPYILGAWIMMCQMHETTIKPEYRFDPSKIDDLIDNLKSIMLAEENDLENSIKTTMYEHGLDFEVMHHFHGAPVQGYMYKRSDGVIKICMTIRGAFADIFWFSLFHELGHLANGDLSKIQFLDYGVDSEKEKAADKFASEKLIPQSQYDNFLVQYSKVPNYNTITKFASEQNVKPYIVIGRMQKEKVISYYEYSFAKTRYKWK